MKIKYGLIILLLSSCGFSADKSGDTNITSNIITGSYNTNQTTCDFTSEKKFDGDGNVEGCNFSEKCDGNVRVTDFIDIHDKDFFAKCENPQEELPIEEEEPTTPPSTIGSAFRKK